MPLDAASVALFLAVALYVVVGNYLYWCVVLPELQRSGDPAVLKLMPSEQIAQVRRVLAILKERRELSWRYHALRCVLPVTIVLLAAALLVGLGYLMRSYAS
jgi:hypothetical protein